MQKVHARLSFGFSLVPMQEQMVGNYPLLLD